MRGVGRDEDGALAGLFRREGDPPRWRRRLRLVGIVALLLLILSAVGDRGVIRLYQLFRARAELSREIDHLRQVNAQLADEVRSLREDPSRVEGIARDELGLVRPGDIVYDFRDAREGAGGDR